MTWTRTSPPLAEVHLEALNTPLTSFTLESMRAEHDLTAAYQRASVWTREQQRDLIRSLRMGVPIGAIIRAKGSSSDPGPYYRVVDGKQRIEAIYAFVDNELDVPADWFPDDDLDLDRVPDDGMIRYEHLTPRGRRGFESRTVAVSEFSSDMEWTDVEPGTGTHGTSRNRAARQRTPAERIAFEAQVFGLINAAGTDQSAEDLARAARIAAGGAS